MHRMRRPLAKVGKTLTLAAVLGLVPATAARAALIRPDASQSFPDLSGDIVGTQSYVYDPTTGTGTFQVNNTPTLLATGPQPSSEFYVNDLAATARSQSLQATLDSSGNLVNDPGNSYKLYGSVTVNGQTYSGLLLQGTPTGFGWAPPNPSTPTMSVYDLNMTITGGLLQQAYGGSAYMRVIAETNSTFNGTFDQSFLGLKAMTNVRSYTAPSPAPVPEPSTFAILLAFGGVGVAYRHRRRRSAAFDPGLDLD